MRVWWLGPYRKNRCKPRQHWVSGFSENLGHNPGYNPSIVVFLRFFGFEPQTNSSEIESIKTVVLIFAGNSELLRDSSGHEKPPSGGFFVPSRSQLNDAAKEELQLDASLYTLLQILSVSVFEKTQLSCALQLSFIIPETPLDDTQLNFFNF